MKNKFLLFLVCLMLLFLPPSNTLANNKVVKSVVVIGFKIEGNFISIGTGVYIKTKIGKGIITAKHVAEFFPEFQKEPIVCTLDLNKCENLSVDFISPNSKSLDKDWAFYRQTFKFLKVSKVDKREMQLEDNVTIIGNSWGFQPWVSKGSVAWIEKNTILIDGFCAPGCSGGGVFYNNKMVGIISAILNTEYGPQPNQILSVPLNKVEIIE